MSHQLQKIRSRAVQRPEAGTIATKPHRFQAVYPQKNGGFGSAIRALGADRLNILDGLEQGLGEGSVLAQIDQALSSLSVEMEMWEQIKRKILAHMDCSRY